jgi:hypothetical protein
MKPFREPLDPTDAKRFIVAAVNSGSMEIGTHAWKEMGDDNLFPDDIFEILLGGVVEPAEFRKGSYRYRVRTSRGFAVVSFDGPERIALVTVWRKKR